MKPNRKQNRCKYHDYSRPGAYFVTICTKERRHYFGEIETQQTADNVGATVPGRPHMKFSKIGKCVENAIKYYNQMDNGIMFEHYVVMPNHIHAIIALYPAGDRGRSPLQYVVRNLKSYVTKNIGFSPWQTSYHDHVIRNRKTYEIIANYIRTNPKTWENDCYNTNS
ncbi:MAG: transposase [Oscillospiraceae bacterium]|nr:transposase [Oscillospiraceae bacterium]